VRGGANVADLRAQVADVQGDLVGEGDEWWIEGEVAEVGAVPERQVAWRAEGDGLGPCILVSDDGRGREHAVAEGVIGVVMGVDHRAHRCRRDGGDGAQVGAGAALGRAGVYADDSLRPHQEAGVVDPPGAIGLDVGVDPGGHLAHLGPPRDRDVAAQAAHQDPIGQRLSSHGRDGFPAGQA
jgi:hypothetical protein